MSNVFVSDKQAKDGETKRFWVESNQTWAESDAVAKHINAHVDTARWDAKAEYGVRKDEPEWDRKPHWIETPNVPGAGVDAESVTPRPNGPVTI